MDLKELKKKTTSELHKFLAEVRDKLRDLRFKDENKQLKNVREIRVIRKTISQVLTLLNKKETSSLNQSAPAGVSEGKEALDNKKDKK